ncbi:hypothetical protein [Rufibacter sp. LB8]|uniref:hypothetical protein n=1 Tax=Rufibacter sp. LB8 TaxID=2777781 RepID=UPI00178C3A68|nr:hypothetical protein [Rufibacter sp. LB8]
MNIKEQYDAKRKNFIEKSLRFFECLSTDYGYDKPTHTESKQPNGVIIYDQIEYINKAAERVVRVSNAYHPVDYGFEIRIVNTTPPETHLGGQLVYFVLKEDQDVEQDYLEKAASLLLSDFEKYLTGKEWFPVNESENSSNQTDNQQGQKSSWLEEIKFIFKRRRKNNS